MSLVVCKLPKAGLGNRLFPLMKAQVFAHLNNLPVTITGYHQFKFGPYLRGEKSKRNYYGNFNFEKNIFGELADKWRARSRNLQICREHPLEEIAPDTDLKSRMYLYGEIPPWNNYFGGLKDYRELVINLFYALVSKGIIKKVSLQPTPCIGVHIRMGDFRKLKDGEDFSKVGAVRTPENYFVGVINGIRNVHKTKMPVSVFSDGTKKELQQILAMENISLVEGNPDIADLILLSKSKIIIASVGSTFGYWAGFLSNSPVILHPDHINSSIRPTYRGDLYEGPMDANNEMLTRYIRSL